jgi:hypothetical protein
LGNAQQSVARCNAGGADVDLHANDDQEVADDRGDLRTHAVDADEWYSRCHGARAPQREVLAMLVRPQAGRAGLRVAALPPRGARSRCPALRAVAFLLTYQGRPHKFF